LQKKIVTSPKVPLAGHYSAAVEANDFIFISGQLPVDPATGKLINDIKPATKQTLMNIQALLEKTGIDLTHVIKITIFMQNIKDFPLVNEVYAEFFPHHPPARSTVEVSRLPKDALLEIEAIAVRESYPDA
jgi:2-iminobutanoate/2-iminopropanoate deaminase